MSGADAFPFPDDDPSDATTLATRLDGWSTGVDTERATVSGVGRSFTAHWDGRAAAVAATEITAMSTFATTTVSGLGDASSQLTAYAKALDTARATITQLRLDYDAADEANDQQQQRARDEYAGQPALRWILEELSQAHLGRRNVLRADYDEAIADLDTSARTVGAALIEIAGRVSPDPASKNPELARIGALDALPYMAVPGQVSVVPTPNGLIVNGTDGDDTMQIQRDPETGDYLLVINGRTYRISEDQAEDMAIRAGDGSDVVDVHPDVQLGVTVSGGDGDDLVAGGRGQDTISGGAGDDDLIGGDGNDATAGGDGDDAISDGVGLLPAALVYPSKYAGRTVSSRGSGGNDSADGGAGNDVIATGSGNDRVRGGDGNDRIIGGEGDDDIDGGDGDDEIKGNDGQDDIDAGDGRDYVDAGEGDDTVDAGEGDDVVYGSTGDDNVEGGEGRDYVDGGAGDDDIDGGADDDMLSGGEGDDVVAGGDGDDVVYTGPGDDVAVGGEGQDDVYAEADDDVVTDADDQVTRVEIDMSLVDEIHIDSDDPEFVARIRSDLVTMASSPAGNELLQELHDTGGGFTITDDGPSEGAVGTYSDGTITYDPETLASSGGDRPPIATLYHEMVHAYNDRSGNVADGFYVGTNTDQLPSPEMNYDTDGDGVTDLTVQVDTDGDGTVEPDELDRDGDGDVDDDDMDLDGDGDVDRDDGWTPNTELQTVGIPHDDDGDPNTADVTGPDRFGYSESLTENGFRRELRWPERTVY